ncbi:hypothetical protein [Sneathiella aquimaris]|uniref:hypothetical protein n=1 Tax=Sneathiella aquimaris TaxID=2599305 RepID=UPI00146C0C3F|nr:hypothetical protein [Sneathiella aquimaris]
MKVFTYPFKEVMREYVRAGIGIGLTALPLLLLRPSSVIVYILGALLCLFILYALRAINRHIAKVCITENKICITGLQAKCIDWEELKAFSVSYFSTRRDGEKGWMQLKLEGRGVRLRIESTITDFEDLVEICATIAAGRGLSFSSATAQNLDILGIYANNHGDIQPASWGRK